MSSETERHFIGGNRNPDLYGLSIRSSSGQPPSGDEIAAAVRILGRPAVFADAEGYECELFAAAVHPQQQQVAYIQSRSKLIPRRLRGDIVDVSIKVLLVTRQSDLSAEIESYNPFFGCDVRHFAWHGPRVLLIYQEKHDTYACRFGDAWPPQFAKIEDSWLIRDSVIHYVGYKGTSVQRLHSATFERLPDLSLENADALGVLPEDR